MKVTISSLSHIWLQFQIDPISVSSTLILRVPLPSDNYRIITPKPTFGNRNNAIFLRRTLSKLRVRTSHAPDWNRTFLHNVLSGKLLSDDVTKRARSMKHRQQCEKFRKTREKSYSEFRDTAAVEESCPELGVWCQRACIVFWVRKSEQTFEVSDIKDSSEICYKFYKLQFLFFKRFTIYDNNSWDMKQKLWGNLFKPSVRNIGRTVVRRVAMSACFEDEHVETIWNQYRDILKETPER